MASSPSDDRLRAAEALLAFWADAGVDACLLDAPADRLAERAVAPPPAPPQLAASALRPPAAGGEEGRADRARALASQATTVEQLAAAARALFGSAAAPFEGDAPARLMVIGDAPGPQDEAEGTPFRGPRGALVRSLLAAAGLGAEVLYANTVFRRTPGGGDPDPAAQAEALPLLARAAAIASPRAVLLLGACAARGVAGAREPILRLRGRWLQWSPEGGEPIPALVTLGADSLLAQPLLKKAAWSDVLSLAARLLT